MCTDKAQPWWNHWPRNRAHFWKVYLAEGGGRKFLGQYKSNFRSQISSKSPKQSYQAIMPKRSTKSEFYYISVVHFQHAYVPDIWSRSSFWVMMSRCAHSLSTDVGITTTCILTIHLLLFTDSSQRNSFWLQILASSARYEPIWLILMISVTPNGI